MLLFYKILSYILLPVAVLFGLMTVMMLFLSLGNIAALLPVFLVGGTVIYIFASFTFLQKGIVGMQGCKKSLKDWIKVNGYVATFFAISLLVQGISVLNANELMIQLKEQVEAMYTNMNINAKTNTLSIIKGVLYFMVALGGIVFTHTTLTFRLLKTHESLFK